MSDGRLFFGRFLLCLRVAFNSTWCATANRRGRERHQQRATGAGTRPGPGSPSSPGRAKAEGNKASARLAGVNAREREPGEGWRVLETAVVRVQAGGANCCTGESTRLATDWTASRARMERMARERQSQVGSSDLSSGVVVDVSCASCTSTREEKHYGHSTDPNTFNLPPPPTRIDGVRSFGRAGGTVVSVLTKLEAFRDTCGGFT